MIIPTVIYDERREPQFINELASQGIGRYDIFPAITDKSSVVASINASHRAIVEIAAHRGDEVCAIMEDDVVFTKPGAWDRFMLEMPGDFDLWMAGCYSPVKDGVTKVPVGFHCYVIRDCYYDCFLSTGRDGHIDASQKDGLYKVCYPMVALQRAGYSFNNKALVDYNEILNDKDIWL